MPRSPEALIKPEMLVWARKAANIDLGLVAKKMGTKETRLVAWERGEERPTVKQLRKLAHIYQQSFAVFFLPVPPRELAPEITDYRRLAGEILVEPSYELTMEIRAAIDRREIALELFEASELGPPVFEFEASMNENPEQTGNRLRGHLGIDSDQQRGWSNTRDAFNAWRLALETTGAMVFQARGITVQEMRGFSMNGGSLPIIVVNRKDALTGRMFSLLHEATHLALHGNGLCDFVVTDRPPEQQRVEVFCNHVAGAALVPRDDLLALIKDLGVREPVEWPEELIRSLANTFKVSREMLLRRLLILGLSTSSYYEEKRREYVQEIQQQQSRGGFVPPSSDVVSAAGKPFARLVLDALSTERITSSDAADYLGVRLKHLPAIAEAVGR